MKYARLSKEQFEYLSKEFSFFLASQSIDKNIWEEIKKNNKEETDNILDNFSDFVWDDILSKEMYLNHISSKNVFLFFCKKEYNKLLFIKTDHVGVDFLSDKGWIWLKNNFHNNKIELYRSKKTYQSSRKKEIFSLIKKGAFIDSGNLFKSIDTFLSKNE